jgi:RNA polymerase sigma factor (sigma-70 family)
MEQVVRAAQSPLRSDAELLKEFRRARSEGSFAEVVRRHAGSVYRVCFRIVGSVQDAEDATQATFLILARRPETVTRTLSGWLHRVACRTAWKIVRARADRARREAAVRTGKVERAMPEEGSLNSSEWKRKLDEALERLPDRLREAVVLRYLENHPEREAARIANCPQGTLGWRAMEGLNRLRTLLSKGGATVGAAALMAFLAREAAAGAPAATVTAAVQTALVPAAGLVSAKVGALVEGGIKAMLYAKLKLAATVVFAVGLGGVSAGVAVYRSIEAVAGAEDKDLPPPIPEAKFQTYFSMIKPYRGEYRWRDEIRWAGTIHEARERAAKENKPILAWQSANSPTLGAT